LGTVKEHVRRAVADLGALNISPLHANAVVRIVADMLEVQLADSFGMSSARRFNHEGVIKSKIKTVFDLVELSSKRSL
jgi:hypothetical protein